MTEKIGILLEPEFKKTGIGTFQKHSIPHLLSRLDAEPVYLYRELDFPFSRIILNEAWKIRERLKSRMEEYDKIYVPSADRMVFDPDNYDTEFYVYVHDIIPTTTGFRLKQNKYLNILSQMFGERWYQNMLKADTLIASSEHVANDIEYRTPYDGNIETVYQGVDHFDLEYNEDLNYHPTYDLIYVGSMIQRKNPEMVEKCARDPDIDMCIVGKPTISDFQNTDYWMDIDDDQLALLYLQSDFYLHPSFVEGFGRTPLEAQRMGCIPIARNTEINNEVLLMNYLKFEDLSDIKKHISETCLDHSLRIRHKENSDRFKWQNHIRSMVSILE